MTLPSPIIHEIGFSKEELEQLEISLTDDKKRQYIINYPTVYVVNDRQQAQKYSVYVGETTDIHRRTIEHINNDPTTREDWSDLAKSDTSRMFVIGHKHFNKSLTLDIENKLMQYLSSVDSVEKVNNRRTNQQNDYYTSNELEQIFSKIWRKLRERNKELFPLESVIKDSALFKASPFHKLTNEQMIAREKIISKIEQAINREKDGQLILVEGEAGSGKTVLMSSLFYELSQLSQEQSDNIILRDTSHYLLVNHDQQLKVYEQIAQKLGILSKDNPDVVSKPTRFINHRNLNDDKVDVIIVDEAHLLWTQGKQAYRGKNQLKDLLARAKVVVAVFDQNQILSREQLWENAELAELRHQANFEKNLIQLHNQLRINANDATVNWIRNLVDNRKISNIPKDEKYDLKVFSTPQELEKAIKQKAKDEQAGISRMLATFDWDYVDKRKPDNGGTWNVTIDDWHAPWNLQLPQTRQEKRENRDKSWAEQKQTVSEIGSTFTIQGFDLNYAGVIIGPSVKYRNGKIIFDREASKNKKATQKRSLKNGQAEFFSDDLLKNELNVLLTRGVNGLYIYAVDDQLRKALLEARQR